MAESPLMRRLRERVKELGHRAFDEFTASAPGAHAVSRAIEGAQRSREALDAQGARWVSALGFATQEDLARVSKKVGRLRKRLRTVLERLEDA